MATAPTTPSAAAPFLTQLEAQIGIVGDFGGNAFDPSYTPHCPIAATAVAQQMTAWLPLSAAQGNNAASAGNIPSYIFSAGDQIYFPENLGMCQPGTAGAYVEAVTNLYGNYIDLSNSVSSKFRTNYRNHGANGMYFFPVIGDHDWAKQNQRISTSKFGETYLMQGNDLYQSMFAGLNQPLNPFTTPPAGDPPYTAQTLPVSCIRYYMAPLTDASVNLFALSNDPNEQRLGTLVVENGNPKLPSDSNQIYQPDMTSPQISWFQNSLQSVGTFQQQQISKGYNPSWNIVMMHQPAFTTSSPELAGHYSTTYFQFFDTVSNATQTNIDLILSGHVHGYQRLHGCDSTQSPIPYIVNGVGGSPESPAGFAPLNGEIPSVSSGCQPLPPLACSQMQATGYYGFQMLLVSPTMLSLQFWAAPIPAGATSYKGSWTLMDHLAILRDGQTLAASSLQYVNGLQVQTTRPSTSGSSLTLTLEDDISLTLYLNIYMAGTLYVGGGGALTIAAAGLNPSLQTSNSASSTAAYNNILPPNVQAPNVVIMDTSTSVILYDVLYILDEETGETIGVPVPSPATPPSFVPGLP